MLSGLDIESVYLCDDIQKHKNLAVICSDNLPLLLHHWHRLIKAPETSAQDNPGIDFEHLLSLLNIKKLSLFHNEAQKNVIALPDPKDLTPNYQFYRNFDMSIVHHRLKESSLNHIIQRSMLSHNITKPGGFIIHQIALHTKINHREYFDLMRHIAMNCGYIWRFAVCNTIDGDQRNLDLMNNFAHLFSDFNQDDFAHLLQEFRHSSLHIREAQLYIMIGFQKLSHREWQWGETRVTHDYVRSPCSEAISMRDNVPEPQEMQSFPTSHFLHNLDKYHYYPFAHQLLPFPFTENIALELLRGNMNEIKNIFNREISQLFSNDIIKKLLLHSAHAFKSYYGNDIFNGDIDSFCNDVFFRINLENHTTHHEQLIHANQPDELITILFYISDVGNARIDYFSPLGGAIAHDHQGIIDDTSLIRPAKSQILPHNHAHIHLSAWNSVWRVEIEKNAPENQHENQHHGYLLFRVDIAHKDIRNMGHFKKTLKNK